MRHGRYIVVRKLAEGGMAEIFLAKLQGPEGFEKPVVLKRIHRAFYEDQTFRDMLVDEAHVSMGLQHNNIVQILDVGRAQDQFFLVLELVDGWDLSRLLDRAESAKRLFPLGIGLYIIAEVCRALAYAHAKASLDGRVLGLVHRDVSPQNVLVSEQGEVKLADFGIAKAMTKREQTGSGVVKGKISFMSPEQANGYPLDHRSDIFAVGSLLYLLVTGARPFEAGSDLETLLRVQEGKFTPAEYVAPDLSPALAAVIRRSMSVSPDDRYQTADELLVDLEGILRAEHNSNGQTELKLWLADLSRADGVPPISRQRHTETRPDDSDQLVAGKALQLGDDDDSGAAADEPSLKLGLDREVGRRERRRPASSPSLRHDLAELGLGAGVDEPEPAPRAAGTEATALTDLELAVGAASAEGPFEDRFAREPRMRLLGTTLVLAVLGGGGYFGFRAFQKWQRESAAVAAPDGPAPTPAVEPPAAVANPAATPARQAQPKRAVPEDRGDRGDRAGKDLHDGNKDIKPPPLRPTPVRERKPGEPYIDPRTGLPRLDVPSTALEPVPLDPAPVVAPTPPAETQPAPEAPVPPPVTPPAQQPETAPTESAPAVQPDPAPQPAPAPAEPAPAQ